MVSFAVAVRDELDRDPEQQQAPATFSRGTPSR